MRRGGFSLIEISVVLIVVSVMISGILPYISESQKTNAANDTMDRIEAIETAMLTYRAANGFIPCPSNIQATLNSAAFGTADATASCAAATNFTDANTAAGGVPTKTLGLPDEMGFDGWGRRMVYHVAKALTTAGTYSGGAGSITVNDAAGTARTTAAAYAIVSHGPNGHGAYTRAGGTARFNFGSTNASEQENCECNATATATTYDSILAQFMATPNSNPLAAYDDIVRYTLKPNLELLVGGGGGGAGLWEVGTGANINDIYNANSGKVGIGTATPAYKLDINGGLRVHANSSLGGELIISGYNSAAPAPKRRKWSFFATNGYYATPGLAINEYTDMDDDDTYCDADGGACVTRLHIREGGNVGIGTTSPTNKLSVGDSAGQSSALVALRRSSAGEQTALEWGHQNPAGYASSLGQWAGGGQPFLCFNCEGGTANNTFRTRGITGRVLMSNNNGSLSIGRAAAVNADNQSPTEDVNISASGNVGIGIVPSYKLHVNGGVGFQGLAADSTGYYLCINSGTNQVTRGGSCSLSDRRLKVDITPIDGALRALTSIEGKRYRWKDHARDKLGGPQIGLIAQDVEKVFPEAVIVNSDGMKGLNYDVLMGPVISAINELSAKVDESAATENAVPRWLIIALIAPWVGIALLVWRQRTRH